MNRRPGWRECGSGLLLGLALAASGCVERLLQVRTDPPGARVFVNGQEVGETPVDHSFGFYGTVGVVVRHDGYRSERVVKKLEAPWYEHFPIDFFAENVLPWTVRDHHLVEVKLIPLTDPEGEEARKALLRRVNEARAHLRGTGKSPVPDTDEEGGETKGP